ncbi:7-methylguanosine phosphate-specific 5'-nucleotidase-like [Achroia grisella]|uniref:7-methylguanosine phosphate-specific 5'-nucleotidase-like n=1 Tax=Achroia grisella TaxID=688607 RepID=UPI0027D223FE|nr:7-methylguanosine phosphate-specific 5'-nucleotidase-like [Achroia grisella]
MKLLSSINEVPVLTKSNVHIKNEEGLLQKLNRIISQGHEKLQIVTDFDHTLTRHIKDDGTPVLTSFGMLSACPSVPQHYKDEDLRLSDIYKPIESNGFISVEEKTKHMVDWYVAGNSLLKGMTFPRNELIQVAEGLKDCFRSGVECLIDWSDSNEVPVLIFSAGLGDCVEAALKINKLLRSNVKIVANFLAMDESDEIVGMQGEIIHTLNKNETAIKNTEYYTMVRNRSNVILMGDNIGDAGMAEGMEHCDVVVKIGYLSRNVEENLQNYRDKFDIVLVNEHTMDVANTLVCLLQ